MTSLADGEIVIAERALAVMTGSAAQTASAGVMIQRLRRGDLTSLRKAGTHLMTIVTVGFWIMLGMTEAQVKGGHILRSARVAA